MELITEEQLSEVKKLFERVDTDKSGTISLEELRQVHVDGENGLVLYAPDIVAKDDKKEVEDAAALEAEDEEDPSNLQLSWEMLELAKMVLLDQLEGEAAKTLTEEKKTTIEKRLFETFLTLGEVSLENENYPQAVEDLTLCLNKQQVNTHYSDQAD